MTTTEASHANCGCAHHGDLPAELILAILSYLDPQNDVADLVTCSRLSRTWNELVRPILFSTLRITFTNHSKEDEDEDEDSDKDQPVRMPKELALIPTLLVQEAPRILPFVRRLCLFQQVGDNYWSWSNSDTTQSEMIYSRHLADILHLFPSLKQLSVTDIVLALPADPATHDPVDLDELEIILKERLTEHLLYGEYLWLLSLFGSVDKITLRGMGRRTFEQYPQSGLVLDTLRVRNIETRVTKCISPILQAINRSPSVAVLESLDIGFGTTRALQELPSLFENLSKPLVHFGCDLTLFDQVPSE